jgi:dienelactone hydrolase
MIAPSDEPLAFWIQPGAPPADADGVWARRFELTSRGDRVPGLLLLPAEHAAPCPVVLLQHGAGGSKHSDYLDAARLPWVRRGVAVASIDFPLHGERSSAKLGAELLATLASAGRPVPPTGGALYAEFARQAVCDLARTLDALALVPELDTGRSAYAGFSLGAILGALFCAADPRPRAAALALGGAGIGPRELDPAAHIGRFAPRPLLFVNATRDERIPRTAAETLHAAAREPKQVAWFDAGHSDLPGVALKAMWQFLAQALLG